MEGILMHTPELAAAPLPAKAPAWRRWGLLALGLYALKGVLWLALGWTVLRH
jgi:hypothetical protein